MEKNVNWKLSTTRKRFWDLQAIAPLSLVHKFRDRREMREDKAAISTSKISSKFDSSISDAGLYPSFCLLASRDDQVFNRFRRSLIYREILEHVNQDQGWAYIEEIEKLGSLPNELNEVIRNDSIGQPKKHQFGEYGECAPSTLRYVKVALDLRQLFGPLDGLSVAEIGIGYGGQCRVINSIWDLKSYSLYDIPEVLSLANRFLVHVGVSLTVVNEIDGRDPLWSEPDLVISNYALSELRREIQEDYLTNVIANAPRGYVTWNHISPPSFQSLTAEELVERIPGAKILPEIPKTHSKNAIIVWGVTESPAS